MSAENNDALPLRHVLERWDALTVRWALDPEERSGLVGGFQRGPIDEVETYQLLCGEERIRLVVDLEPVLRRAMQTDAKICEWLRSPNPNLGGRTPLNVMSRSPEWMRWLIKNAGVFS